MYTMFTVVAANLTLLLRTCPFMLQNAAYSTCSGILQVLRTCSDLHTAYRGGNRFEFWCTKFWSLLNFPWSFWNLLEVFEFKYLKFWSLHCSLFNSLPWSASSSSPDDEPHLLVQNASAKNFSYVISTKRLCLIHYGWQKSE